MLEIYLAVFAIGFYLATTCLYIMRLKNQVYLPDIMITGMGSMALGLHSWLLYYWFCTGTWHLVLNLTDTLSAMIWLTTSIILLATPNRLREVFGIVILPLAAMAIAVFCLLPNLGYESSPVTIKETLHILLSMLTISVLVVAALQATFLVLQDKALRHKKENWLARVLPPLETMERFLFKMIIYGVLCLSILLVSSFYSFYPLFTRYFFAKSFFTIGAWWIFVWLLAGHYLFGWRGKKVAYSTISGVWLLVIIYVASEILGLFL